MVQIAVRHARDRSVPSPLWAKGAEKREVRSGSWKPKSVLVENPEAR